MYHRLCAAVSGNTTLSDRTECEPSRMSNGIFTLSHAYRQKTYIRLPPGVGTVYHKAFPPGRAFQCELIPIRSPLLWKAYSVSAPPLIYMLKFSRYPGLSSDLYTPVANNV